MTILEEAEDLIEYFKKIKRKKKGRIASDLKEKIIDLQRENIELKKRLFELEHKIHMYKYQYQ